MAMAHQAFIISVNLKCYHLLHTLSILRIQSLSLMGEVTPICLVLPSQAGTEVKNGSPRQARARQPRIFHDKLELEIYLRPVRA